MKFAWIATLIVVVLGLALPPGGPARVAAGGDTQSVTIRVEGMT